MQKLPGLALLSVALGLFAVLAYEPAQLSTALQLEGTLDEGAVVLLSLLTVGACGIAGIAALRSAHRSA